MRYYVGIGPGADTLVKRNIRTDQTGEPLILLDQFEIGRVRYNMTDWLESGETISSATVTGTNCTVSTSTTSPNVDITFSNVSSNDFGTALIRITSSSGDVWAGTIRVRRRNRYTDEQTYRDYR